MAFLVLYDVYPLYRILLVRIYSWAIAALLKATLFDRDSRSLAGEITEIMGGWVAERRALLASPLLTNCRVHSSSPADDTEGKTSRASYSRRGAHTRVTRPFLAWRLYIAARLKIKRRLSAADTRNTRTSRAAHVIQSTVEFSIRTFWTKKLFHRTSRKKETLCFPCDAHTILQGIPIIKRVNHG